MVVMPHLEEQAARYQVLMRAYGKQVAQKFTPEELLWVFGALNGVILQSYSIPYLEEDLRDEVPPELLEKVQGLDLVELFALTDLAERFWDRSDQGLEASEVLQELFGGP